MNGRGVRVTSIALVALAGVVFVWLAVAAFFSEPVDGEPVVVAESERLDEDLVVMSHSVEIVGRVRGGVLVLGGDISVRGTVDGDVAAIGGSITQTEDSHISGDVLIVGGEYHAPTDLADSPCRKPSSETVVLSGSARSLREFFTNPTRELLAPHVDRYFVGWRVATAFTSFLLAVLIVAVAPAQISRASERLLADPIKIAAIGLVGTVTAILLAGLVLVAIPAPASALISAVLLLGLVIVQLFGRVVAYFLIGRWLQRRMLGDRSRSQTVALLLGVVALALVGSLPVVGALLVFATFIVSIGILLTAPGSAPAVLRATDLHR
jgi:hypothetical protein